MLHGLCDRTSLFKTERNNYNRNNQIIKNNEKNILLTFGGGVALSGKSTTLNEYPVLNSSI